MADSDTQPMAITLPPEILERIGSYISRMTLPDACLVCKYWLTCLRPFLWRDIHSSAFTGYSFIQQFPQHYDHVNKLTIAIPFVPEELTALFGLTAEHVDDQVAEIHQKKKRKAAASLSAPEVPSKTLMDCRRLEFFSVHYCNDMMGVTWAGRNPGDTFAEKLSAFAGAIDSIIENNISTLRELRVTGLANQIDKRIRDLIKQMPRLESLTLEEWRNLSGPSLCELLQICSPRLETLSLEMNVLREEFWDLQLWRAQWDTDQNTKRSGGAKKDNTFESKNPLDHTELTKIRTLVMDRSSLTLRSLLNFASVMPELRELSLRDTSGIGMENDDDESDGFFDDDEEMEDQSDSDDGSDSSDDSDSNDDSDSSDDSDSNDDSDYSESVYMAMQDAISPVCGTEDETDPYASYRDYDGDGDGHGEYDDYDDYYGDDSDYIGIGVWNDDESGNQYGMDDQGEINPEAMLMDGGGYSVSAPYPAHSAYPAYPAFDQHNSRIYRKMRQMQKYCPLIQSFDFSDCRSEGLDETFFSFICELWGPLAGTSSTSNISAATLSKPPSVLSPGLKAVMFEDVCAFKPGFFDVVLRHCGSTLTELHLSMIPLHRWKDRSAAYEREIRDGVYYGGVINILKTCSTLELLHVDPYPVDARSIASQKEEWACTRLKSLHICIEFDKTPVEQGSGSKAELQMEALKKDREIQIQTCRRLGGLKRLEELTIEGGRPITINGGTALSGPQHFHGTFSVGKRGYLALSLNNGLSELAGLEQLQYFDVVHLGPHELRSTAEVEWLGTHWPALRRIDGFWDRDILNRRIIELTGELGPMAYMLPNDTQAERTTRRRYELVQKKGIRLYPDLDHVNDSKVLQLRKLRNQDTFVDGGLVPLMLDMNGLEAVSVLEKSRSPEDGREERTSCWYVKYVDNGIRQPYFGPAVGGRHSHELMSDVMRPRDGRSPSPLGTWY